MSTLPNFRYRSVDLACKVCHHNVKVLVDQWYQTTEDVTPDYCEKCLDEDSRSEQLLKISSQYTKFRGYRAYKRVTT